MTVAKSDVKGMTVFNTNKVNTKKQPMFFGQPLGVQRYDSYKYPVFDRLTQSQLGYFWRPEEVSLQKDRSDYQTLTPEQKHIFTSNLKYQIMLDSVQGRGPGMAFIPYCSLPELEACMTVWEFMEMIHSRSYTYIIKNVYSDPAEVFDTILDDDNVMKRAESVTESYNDFIDHAHEFDNGQMWDLARDGHTTGRYDRKFRLRVRLLLARINLWRVRQRYSLLSLEMKVNTWLSHKISSRSGHKETIQRWKKSQEKKKNM